jgi:hypothetical protein
MFSYLEPFGELNPHLDKRSVNNPFQQENSKFKRDYCIERNPPNVLGHQAEYKEKLQSIFNFSDLLFQKHYVFYNEHYIEMFPISNDAILSNPDETTTYIAANIRWGNGFYHFMTESLPMILYVNKMTNKNYDIVCNRSGFCESVLRYFGVQNPIYIDMPPLNKKFAIRMPTIECGNPSLEKIQLIREIICTKTIFMPKWGILIYRKEQLRFIHNFNDVLEMLKRIYPEITWYVFDSLPIQESVRLFSRAKIIVGAHGAGLTNMLFSPNGTTVVEFSDMANPNICYWHLSETLKNKHYIIPHETIENQFTIDIERVEPLFKDIRI